MTQKRILVINGHPGQSSLSYTFAEAYASRAAQAGHDLRHIHIANLSFDMDYGKGGYSDPKPLEPEIAAVLADIEWAEHIVLTTPMWWGSMPAKLKGLMDRILLPGRTFDTRNPNRFGLPAPMLTGRTARVIVTSDSPRLYLRLVHGDAMLRQIKGQIFGFIGIKPTRFTYFSGASHPKPGQVERWTEAVRTIASEGR